MSPRVVRVVLLLVVLAAVPLGVLGDGPPAAARDGDAPAGRLPSYVAAPRTPQVLDGRVYSVVQVGRTIVLSGTFTRVREDGSKQRLVRRGLVAFDAATGRIKRRFAPNPNGEVHVVLPSTDGRTIYVGGGFTTISGSPLARLAQIRVGDGSVVASFAPGRVNGTVKDLAVVRGRLWVGGAFSRVDGHRQRALATLQARTGRRTPFMSLQVRGNHQRGVTQVLKIAASPDGSRLVAIGNFDRVGGRRARQLVVLDTGGRRAGPGALRTGFYSSSCSRRFDTSMRDVDVSPDGSYFVVGTTGSYGGPTVSCDSVARFEMAATGSNVAPSWVAYSGGDTTYSVEATASAVFVGGHQRWWNNPYAGNRPGPGAVARRGIAALDPLNGLPLSWDPGRDRGVGVFDFRMTPAGLWVASDTTRVGRHQLKSRIAMFPVGGAVIPANPAPRLPGSVYLGGPAGEETALRRRTFDGRAAGPVTSVAAGALDWSTVRGAFVVAGRIYVAHADGRFTAQKFKGVRLAAEEPVTTSDRLVPLRGWADDVRHATGMLFDAGRIYFTRRGSPHLFYRYFTPQSGVVGAQRFVAPAGPPGLDLAQVRGMFVASDRFYWATPDGVLHSLRWRRGGPSGTPVGPLGPTWSTGSAGDGGWAARALFVLAG